VRGSRAPRPRHHQAARAEERTNGRATRPVGVGLAPRRDGEQLLRPPARMPPALRDEQLHQFGIRRVRTLLRPPRSILQAGRAGGGVAFEPLVPGLPADSVLRGELGHCEQRGLELTNEIQALLHGRRFAPRHRGTSGEAGAPSLWRLVLPMSLD